MSLENTLHQQELARLEKTRRLLEDQRRRLQIMSVADIGKFALKICEGYSRSLESLKEIREQLPPLLIDTHDQTVKRTQQELQAALQLKELIIWVHNTEDVRQRFESR